MPLTEPAAGKASTSPAGQWVSEPGLAVKPQTPPMRALVSETVRSLPAAEVTCITRAALMRRIASRTSASSSARGAVRSRISGCSLLTTSTRAPPFRISGSSAACCRPSTVQSATNTLPANALTTGCSRPMASDAPVDRTGTGADCRGVGSTTWNQRAPSRASASSLNCTSDGRDRVSDNTAQASPGFTPHRRNTSTKLSIHLASMRSVMLMESSLTRVHTHGFKETGSRKRVQRISPSMR